MPGSMLIFAPHASSYDRLVPGAHAPTGIAWAHENRTTALRVPAGNPAAKRIEHRVAGGDINPYLFLAAILGAALNGIEDAKAPPPPITGNAYDHDLAQLPRTWDTAIAAFADSPEIKRIFAPTLIDNLLATKRQELHYMAELSPEEQQELYLDTV
jgi:glutamine synthetase